MSKFVIAGKANCPYYAKAELLGDNLERNLPNFRIHKILIDPKNWDEWLNEICTKNKWKHTKSPIIWRELVDRGGKGMLIGDTNDFLEYAKGYYDISTDLTSIDLKKISNENEKTYQIIQEEYRAEQARIKPINLTISNPDSPILYYVILDILNGNVFGPENDVFVRLYSEVKSKNIDGVKMEIEDLASTKLRKIKICYNAEDAFKECDFAILFDELGSADSKNNSENPANSFHNPYIKLASDIDKYAKQNCKILLTPFISRSETYAIVNVFSKHLQRIDSKKNLIGNSLYQEMLAKSILAHRLKINPAYIKNVSLIGQSLEASCYLDLSQGKVTDFDGAVWARTNTHWLSLVKMVADKEWMQKDFLSLIHDRENLIIEKICRNGVYLFSQSVIKLISLWIMGKSDDDDSFFSAIVHANGNYSLKENIFISLPVRFENGSFNPAYNFRLNNQTSLVVSEIIKDTKKKISDRYHEDTFIKDIKQTKLPIPHVIIE